MTTVDIVSINCLTLLLPRCSHCLSFAFFSVEKYDVVAQQGNSVDRIASGGTLRAGKMLNK